MASDFEVDWWEDSHIKIGEDWRKEILTRINEADFSLQLISPSFLTSQFIVKYEIPPFLGENPRCLPVSLINVPLDHSNIEWHGIKAHQIFRFKGKDFQRCNEVQRTDFLAQLAAEVWERIRRVNGDSSTWRRL